MKTTKRYRWTVEFEVDATWVADGFNLTDDRAFDMLQHDLSYARPNELSAHVIKSPSNAEILKEQGY